ncbi:MAG: hypothetical protein J6Y69_05655 [Treponema sp.]|nr:hypothetical protein [Treponema sp.]
MFKKSTIILAALCAVTMGMFVGCKHNTGDSGEPAPSLAGTYYSFEVVAEEDFTLARDAFSVTCVYKFNPTGFLTSVTEDGEPGDLEDYRWATREYFRSVTLSDDGRVTSFGFDGTEQVTEANASSFSYQITDAGISVSVVFNDDGDEVPDTFVLQAGEDGVYTLYDERINATWKFKKA